MAAFLGAAYMTRGKSGLDDEEIWMVVVEDHGNPSGLSRRDRGEENILSFSVSFEGEPKRTRMEKPVVVGDGKKARDIAEFFGLEYAPGSANDREIRAGDREIEFFDEGELVLRLNISG